jgi:hypothetical protein
VVLAGKNLDLRPFELRLFAWAVASLQGKRLENEMPEGFWWSRWDCRSALEENQRKTAKFQCFVPFADLSDVT